MMRQGPWPKRLSDGIPLFGSRLYCTVICGILFSILCVLFSGPLLELLGAGRDTCLATDQYMKWTVYFGATPAILNVVMAYLVRAEGSGYARQYRDEVSGCFLNILLDPFLFSHGDSIWERKERVLPHFFQLYRLYPIFCPSVL